MLFAKKSSNWGAYLLALISGGIGFFAYSPFDYWGIAFLSAGCFLWITQNANRKTALVGAFLWAVSYFSVGVNWVHISMIQFGGVPEIVSYVVVVLLAAYLALYFVLFSYIRQRFSLHSPWALAALFTFTEYLREVVFTGFPWLQWGYSLIDSPFAGIAPILGVEGLSFFVILVSAYALQLCGVQAVKYRLNLPASLSLVGLLLAAWATQFVTVIKDDPNQPALNVSLVQGNIEQKMKWDPVYFESTIMTYQRLIMPLLGRSDVIILPESAIPASENNITSLFQQFDQAARQYGSELIVGSLYQNHQGYFNSAVVLGQVDQPYHLSTSARYFKHHLVPFGEYVPLGQALDWLRDVFVLPVNLSQGDYIQPALQAGKKRFNLAICYEIIFGDQLQKNQQHQNADYLLTISNDAWFGQSIGPWQHFQIARMRALELGKPLIRSTNTGITAFVDPRGQVVAQAPQFESTVLTHSVKPTLGETLFAQFGRLPLYLFAGCCFILALFRRFREWRK